MPLAALLILGLVAYGSHWQNSLATWAAAVLGAALLGFCLLTIPSLVRRSRLARAFGRLPERWRDPGNRLPDWPGLHERNDELVARRTGTLLPAGFFFTLPSFAILGLSQPLGGGHPTGELVFLALGTVPPLVALLVGPFGWRLVANGARQDVCLTRLRPFWRQREKTASLPTVKTIRIAGERKLVIELTRGAPWELEFPPDWPPELGRALAGRLAHLAGIEIAAGAAPADDDNADGTPEGEAEGEEGNGT